MQKKFISFEETKRFSKLITDYLGRSVNLDPFYGTFPLIENFRQQIALKKGSYSAANRQVLTDVLKLQYEAISYSDAVNENLNLLKNENTFTITTGHQLSLMTGPLYFLYKIISTINLCKRLKNEYPDFDFVPIYWMASEDHDFEEISSFRFQNKSIRWPKETAGAVGEMSLEDLLPVLDIFEQHLGESINAQQLKDLMKASYRKSKTLSEATFRLVNLLFGQYGLIVLEPHNPQLKTLFKPIVKEELTKRSSYKEVNSQIEKLKQDYDAEYKPQVNPRDINLFYLSENGRYRIEKKEDRFYLNGTEQSFTESEILEVLESNPEKFSPNVILRPIYQECILPNLCYVGGGGELAYWFQLKSTFDYFSVPFPSL